MQMTATDLQLLGNALLAPARVGPDQLLDLGAQTLATQLGEHLVSQVTQVIAQYAVGLNLRQPQLLRGKTQLVALGSKMHRATDQLPVTLRCCQWRMAQPDSGRLEAPAGGPAGQIEQAAERCLRALGLAYIKARQVFDKHQIGLTAHLEITAVADHRGVFEQFLQRLAEGIAGHQQHAQTVQVPDLNLQPELQAGQRVVAALAERFPQLVLPLDRHTLQPHKPTAQIIGQADAQALGQLQHGLTVTRGNALFTALVHGLYCRFPVPFGAIRAPPVALDSTS